jgi:hypothetical protein
MPEAATWYLGEGGEVIVDFKLGNAMKRGRSRVSHFVALLRNAVTRPTEMGSEIAGRNFSESQYGVDSVTGQCLSRVRNLFNLDPHRWHSCALSMSRLGRRLPAYFSDLPTPQSTTTPSYQT